MNRVVKATLDNPDIMAERIAAIDAPHMRPLNDWRASMMARDDLLIPYFDPFDGGTEADILLLLETPGPGRTPLSFVSQDNASGTAANLRKFFAAAGIDRKRLVIWNAVPWIIHEAGASNRAPRTMEIKRGLVMLADVLALLPKIKSVILSGRAARSAEAVIAAHKPDAAIFAMPHPSPTYVCTKPTIAGDIVQTLRTAAG